jgi:glycosyl transferase family 25
MNFYVINLDRAPQRLDYMRRTLSKMGLDFVRVAAVDGSKMTEAQRHQIQEPSKKFYYLGPGELGCFLSHRLCWKLSANADQTHACIFEDDVHLSPDTGEILRDTSWIPSDADIIKIETNFAKTLIESNSLPAPCGRSISKLLGKHTSSGGYIISRECARRLYTMTEVVTAPLDQFVFNPVCEVFNDLKIYQLAPALCVQDSILSERTGENLFESELDVERSDLLGDAKPTWFTIPGFIRKVHKHRTLWAMRLRSLSDSVQILRVPYD